MVSRTLRLACSLERLVSLFVPQEWAILYIFCDHVPHFVGWVLGTVSAIKFGDKLWPWRAADNLPPFSNAVIEHNRAISLPAPWTTPGLT